MNVNVMQRTKNLASYTRLMEGPFCFMCSIGKTSLFTKVGDKQLGLKLLASFTNIDLDTFILL